MQNKEDLKTQIANSWLDTSLKASNTASDGLVLGIVLSKNDKALRKAITGGLNNTGYQKVIDWIVNRLPITDNAFRDSLVLETGWMSYSLTYLSDYEDDETFSDQEAEFLLDLRSAFLAKRLTAVQENKVVNA